MSREIKFRAWNSVTKEMEQVTQINLKNHYVQTTFNKIGYSYVQPDDVIVEQYTGMKDANGKEIYEGDIVRVSDVDGNGGYVDTVIWGGEDDYPAFDLKNHAVEYDSNALSSIVNGGFETIEVIGNIHENPELLEEDK